MEQGLTIGQLAKRIGINIETIRYYERLHLLAPHTRKPSGYRIYGSTEHLVVFLRSLPAFLDTTVPTGAVIHATTGSHSGTHSLSAGCRLVARRAKD
jgi:hypothetical protein